MKLSKKENRLRRARRGRSKIRELEATRLSVHRTPRHIYAQVIAAHDNRILASASSLEAEVRSFPQPRIGLSHAANLAAKTNLTEHHGAGRQGLFEMGGNKRRRDRQIGPWFADP